jgi:hypothetical protein
MIDPEIDPRVAAAGGTRRHPKEGYYFPGMARDSDWRTTRVHKATIYYGCAFCRQGFKGPHAVYTHIAKVHGGRRKRKGPAGG